MIEVSLIMIRFHLENAFNLQLKRVDAEWDVHEVWRITTHSWSHRHSLLVRSANWCMTMKLSVRRSKGDM